MIDLHNHLLPGIDDGAPDLLTALKLARIAEQDGITHMVCTPHIHPGRYDNSPAIIGPTLALLQQALQDEGIQLQLASAAEVRFGVEIMAQHANGELPFLGQWQGKQVLLLEFPHSEIPFGAERLTDWLLQRDIIPMIAHPERNKGLMRQPSKLKPLLSQGCLLQITAGAVVGRFGDNARALATQLLKENRVTLLATDAHNLTHRPPVLSEGLAAAAALIGDSAAQQLVKDNPWQIAASHFA
ncbi:tyrosine-protein phosphatase [Halopseudomonas salegens]|uniref:protein-tyrosine-phosphatase n=1 Tax=Halopseudomonas salegens TaxID=1434072 RepID=A0A1H2FL72_9GAMM|nr:CpsB/CapC family capsule biosynthesis tyrosine phosphatase [Halopseudomonas salegens]SDU08062.1 protein-tyrosine phosphatase [Halopseudomonas salegens]